MKRVAIIGTAPSWVRTPWSEPGLEIWGLNDGYAMVDPLTGAGMPRADAWFDLHPMAEMWFRPKAKKVFKEDELPEGKFIRPEGHIDWLKTQAKTIPVWLEAEPPNDWPANAHRFPFDEVRRFLKARPDQDTYIASSPVQMLAFAILRGYQEIQIYGIHLATQKEYLEQRPNFEWLLGRAAERGIAIVLPPECPLLKHSHVYGREPAPNRAAEALLKQVAQAQRELSTLTVTVAMRPRWKSKAADLERMVRLRGLIRDTQLRVRHATLTATVGG